MPRQSGDEDRPDDVERRGRLAAVKAFAGMVALGAVYALFNHRISERDRRRHGWGGRRR
ncbi:MAG: hypothetical protein ACRDJO_04865 [Actinomycetota bacterium]